MNSNGDRGFDADAVHGEPLDASQLAEARLTAYVLGELADEERDAVAKELAESEPARRHVDAIRRSVDMLTAALATEPVPQSPTAGPVRILQPLNPTAQSKESDRLPVRRTHRARRYLVAASLLGFIIAGTGWIAWWSTRRTRQIASVPVRVEQVGGSVMRAVQAEHEADRAGGRYKNMASDITYPDTGAQQDVYSRTSTRQRTGSKKAVARPAEAAWAMPANSSAPVGDAGGQPDFALASNSMHDLREEQKTLSSAKRSQEVTLPRIIIQEEETPLLVAQQHNTEAYDRIDENPFLDVRQNPLSTFSIDVDTASYANLRRFLNAGSLPPKDAVRIEEMINYFTYHYAPPTDDKPFAVHAEVAGCPWEPKHRLLRIALKGREIDLENRPASNLVFLIDVSGSMDQPAKLPLLKSSLRLLIDKLAENDRVAMVVYAGSSGMVLPSTSGLYKETILAALDQLQAGGSTNGGSGIQLAYRVAREKFIKGGTNRVILCTDGDFNVGVTDQGSLTRLIEDEAASGVFLSVLGFGAGNLKDSTMEQLADRGNGNYAFIDTAREARKVLVEQIGGTLVTIAKDVKLQLEFNPRQVSTYRLIGYENRLLRAEDFNDDKKDAGEIGAGHTVTALYELVPAGENNPAAKADELKYQRLAEPAGAAKDELLTLKLRYKQPDGDTSQLIEQVVNDAGVDYARASEDFRFAAAVAGFGLVLRDSQYKGNLTWDAMHELAEASRGSDVAGYRREMVELIKKAQTISH